MYEKVLFIALFGVILFGLAYFFLTYYKKYNTNVEGFQSITPYIVQSDLFPDISIPYKTFDVSGFSMAYTIEEDFINFITDWHNFSGNMDRIIRTYDFQYYSGNESYNYPTITIEYNDNNGNTVYEDINIANDLRITFYDSTYRINNTNIPFYNQITPVYNDVSVTGSYCYSVSDNDTLCDYNDPREYNSDPIGENGYNNTMYIPGYEVNSTNFSNNFTNYINMIQNNNLSLKKRFLQNIQQWNYSGLATKINSTYYSTSNWYNCLPTMTTLTWSQDYTVLTDSDMFVEEGDAQVNASINIGTFRGVYSNYTATDVNTAQTEKLRINVYGTVTSNHQQDFNNCILYGAAFNFNDNGFIDLYLNIPYRDSNLNGSKIYYSYGLFLTEVRTVSSDQPFNYTSNDMCIKYNQYVNKLYNYTNNTIQTPSAFIQSIGYDQYNTINSIIFDNNNTWPTTPTISLTTPIRNLRIDQQFVGQVNPQILSFIPQTMHRYMTSYAYNMSARVLDANLSDITQGAGYYGSNGNVVGSHTNIDQASYLMALAYNNYELATNTGDTSNANNWSNYLNKWFYNNINQPIIPQSFNIYNHGVGSGFFEENDAGIINPIIFAQSHAIFMGNMTSTSNYSAGVVYNETNQFWPKQFNDTESSQISNYLVPDSSLKLYLITFTGTNPNLSYQTTGDTWDLDDNTIENMTSDYKSLLQKLLPDYGSASNINVLDNPTLNFIAQKFYDYSEGLSEIVMIYDVYIIGSNMMDIRFDKKQRLPPDQYLSLRNAYIPQLDAYNNLLAQYNEGTWVDSGLYSNTTDVQNNLSTMLISLDPIFNPIYTLSNANPSDLQNQINILTTTNSTLTASVTAPIGNINTDSSLSNFSISPSAQAQLNANTQVQAIIDSNTNLIYQLSNQLLGIETNVARIFFTYYDGSNGGVGGIITSNYIASTQSWVTYTIVINGLALGSNASLSYNNIYNANLEVDIGQSQGNVNYQPAIDYDYNITPPIQCCNISFMQQAATLYTNGIYNDLSGYTSNIYASSNGDVLVDKVFGFTQLDDNTCGFTWQESQYDPYTNEPTSRIVDVELKFAYDNTQYEQPILMLDNTRPNIYFTDASNIANIRNTIIPGINSNIANLQSELNPYNMYLSNNYASNLSKYLSNYLNGNYVYLSDYCDSITNNCHVITMSLCNYYMSNHLSLDINTFIQNMKNITFQVSAGMGFADCNGFYLRNNGVYPIQYNGIDTINYLQDVWGDTFTQPIKNINLSNIIAVNLTVDNDYFSLLDTIENLPQQYYIKNILSNIQLENSLIVQDSNINSQFQFGTLDINDYLANIAYIKNIPYSLSNLTSIYLSNINTMNIVGEIMSFYTYIGTLSNYYYNNPHDNNFNFQENGFNLQDTLNYKSTITASNTLLPSIQTLVSNINLTSVNPYIIIERELPTEVTLTNSDGACPANLTCEDPDVMGQLLDFYNLGYLDSNNPQPITRILKGWTVNPYQCDYLVEYADSNGNSTQDSISFQIGQDIQSCQYYIGSNLGFGTGYFIMDKTPYVEDTYGTDISGFQYVGNALTDFLSTVTTTINPMIVTACNAVSEMYNAFAEARMMTYNAMGRINSNSNFNYNTIKQALTTDARFVNSFFNSFPTITSYTNVNLSFYYTAYFADGPNTEWINKTNVPFNSAQSNIDTIIRVGITNTNTIVIVYNGNIQYNGFQYNNITLPGYPEIQDGVTMEILSPYVASNSTEYFTGAAEYSITVNESGSYIANYMGDKEPIPPNQASNMNISLDYVNINPIDPLTTFSYIIDDLNIKQITSLLISDPSFCYDNYNNSNTSNINFIDPVFLQLTGLLPITYSPIGTSLNTVEYVINPTNAQTVESHFIIVQFDFDRTKFQSNSQCWVKENNRYTIDSYKNSQFYRTYTASDQSNLDTFRNYFNTNFSITNGYPYNSVIGQIYTCDTNSNDVVTYSASVYYKDSDNNYITTVVPNIPEFNNVRHFTCRLLQLPSVNSPNSNLVNIYNFVDVGTGGVSGTSVNDTNSVSTAPTRDYYISHFNYTNFIFKHSENIDDITNNTLEEAGDDIDSYGNFKTFQISQLSFFNGSNRINLNINSNIHTYLTGNNIYNTITNNYILNYNNINTINSNNVNIYQFIPTLYYQKNSDIAQNSNSEYIPVIEIDLLTPVTISGYSVTSGNNPDMMLQSWNLYGSIDNGDNYIILDSKTNYYDTNYPGYFGTTSIISIINSRTNINQNQLSIYNPIYNLQTCGYDPENAFILNNINSLFPINSNMYLRNIISYRMYPYKIVYYFETYTSLDDSDDSDNYDYGEFYGKISFIFDNSLTNSCPSNILSNYFHNNSLYNPIYWQPIVPSQALSNILHFFRMDDCSPSIQANDDRFISLLFSNIILNKNNSTNPFKIGFNNVVGDSGGTSIIPVVDDAIDYNSLSIYYYTKLNNSNRVAYIIGVDIYSQSFDSINVNTRYIPYYIHINKNSTCDNLIMDLHKGYPFIDISTAPPLVLDSITQEVNSDYLSLITANGFSNYTFSNNLLDKIQQFINTISECPINLNIPQINDALSNSITNILNIESSLLSYYGYTQPNSGLDIFTNIPYIKIDYFHQKISYIIEAKIRPWSFVTINNSLIKGYPMNDGINFFVAPEQFAGYYYDFLSGASSISPTPLNIISYYYEFSINFSLNYSNCAITDYYNYYFNSNSITTGSILYYKTVNTLDSNFFLSNAYFSNNILSNTFNIIDTQSNIFIPPMTINQKMSNCGYNAIYNPFLSNIFDSEYSYIYTDFMSSYNISINYQNPITNVVPYAIDYVKTDYDNLANYYIVEVTVTYADNSTDYFYLEIKNSITDYRLTNSNIPVEQRANLYSLSNLSCSDVFMPLFSYNNLINSDLTSYASLNNYQEYYNGMTDPLQEQITLFQTCGAFRYDNLENSNGYYVAATTDFLIYNDGFNNYYNEVIYANKNSTERSINYLTKSHKLGTNDVVYFNFEFKFANILDNCSFQFIQVWRPTIISAPNLSNYISNYSFVPYTNEYNWSDYDITDFLSHIHQDIHQGGYSDDGYHILDSKLSPLYPISFSFNTSLYFPTSSDIIDSNILLINGGFDENHKMTYVYGFLDTNYNIYYLQYDIIVYFMSLLNIDASVSTIYYIDSIIDSVTTVVNETFVNTNPYAWVVVNSDPFPYRYMKKYNIDATNPLLINYINSLIQEDSQSENRIDTITNIMTDYNNLQTSYINTVWQNGTDINSLQTTSPQYMYQYTLNLSNFTNHSNFSYSLSNPNSFGTVLGDFSLNGMGFDSSTTYSNSIVYNNGILFDLNAPLISWAQCWSNMNPIDPLNTNFIFNNTVINIGGSYTGYTVKGIVANKKNTSTKQNDYILDIYYPSHTTSNYYYAVKVVNLYPDVYQQCEQYYTAYDGYSVFQVQSIANITPYNNTTLSNYIYTNGYTSNYISNTSEGFTNQKPSYNFISLESTNPFTISDFQLFTHRDTPIESKLIKKESTMLVLQIGSREVIGYSFTTNSTSPEYDPQTWTVKAFSGKNQTTLDSRKIARNLPRNYQLPLMYINGNTRTKVLPQKTIQNSTTQEEETINKNIFIKYYKQKINPSMTIQPKKYIKDSNIYYILYDEYDLNKNLIGNNNIVGFVMEGGKIKKAILYEDDEGNMKPFDLKKKHMKTYWDSHVMLPLLFQDF